MADSEEKAVGVGPEAFGEDYLYFYETWLTDDVHERQADLVWRLLELEPGVEVLDVACGHGRIANRLARRGARVTGLDADPYFLERAREAGAGADYVEGDMRELPFPDASFDAALLWFTSFGYFDDGGNRAVLRELRRVLRPGGRAVLDLNHLPRILETFQRQSFVRRGADVMLDEHQPFRTRDAHTGDDSHLCQRRRRARNPLPDPLLSAGRAPRVAARGALRGGRDARVGWRAAHAGVAAVHCARASSVLTSAAAWARRSRFAGELSQPLAPDGCGSGMTGVPSRS